MDSPEKTGDQERKAFNQLSFEDQEKRFNRFREIFGKSSRFIDFWNNAHQRADKFVIEGTPKEQVPTTLDTVYNGINFIRSILNYFRLIKLKEAGQNDEAQFQLTNDEVMHGMYALPIFLEGGKINIQQVSKMFEWSLQAYIQKEFEEAPLPPDIGQEEISGLEEDLVYMLDRVNDYLH